MDHLEPRPPEVRSWEPPTVKIDPITSARPTNADLGRGVNQLHECLEGLKGDHNRRLSRVERDLHTLKDTLGVGEQKKKIAGTQTTRAAWWRTFSAVGGALAAAGVLLRLAEVMWPWVKGGGLAILHAMLTGKL